MGKLSRTDVNGLPAARLMNRVDYRRLTLGAVVLVGVLLRLYLAVSSTYLWDEDREWIPLARSISLSDSHVNLPWRSVTHPAASAYIAKATSAVLGENPLGYRIGFVLAGGVAIWAVAMLALEWVGFPGALVAAVAMSFNEYHLAVSALVVEKSPYLMFSALAMLHFGRFLKRENVRNLYFAAAAAGLAFLFKETAGLLLPVFVIALLASGKAAWLTRRESVIALGVGAVIVLPDIVWNIRHWDRGFGLHASRMAGFGLNRHFLLFFGRDLVRDVYQSQGIRLFDPVPEYPAMNAIWGAVLLGAAGLALLAWRRLEGIGRLAVASFWTILLFFVSSKPAASRFIQETQTMIDGKAWFWIDQTLIGGSLLAAWSYASLTRRWCRVVIGTVIVAACALSTSRLIADRLGMPVVNVVLVPNAISRTDGRLVDVRAFMMSCQICDARFRLVQTTTNRFDDNGPVPSSTDDILGGPMGDDVRQFQVRATTGPHSDRRAYRFTYAVSGGRLPARSISAVITIANGSHGGLLPFWAR